MDEIVITNFKHLSEADLKEIKEIFFEASARQSFSSASEKEEFYQKYLGFYIGLNPELNFMVKIKDHVVGYIVCAEDTLSVYPELQPSLPYMELFTGHFTTYPAHLHINVRADSRGQGLGEKLVVRLEQALKMKGIKGLHLVTSATAKNVHFYQKLGFNFRSEVLYQERPLLFLGKRL